MLYRFLRHQSAIASHTVPSSALPTAQASDPDGRAQCDQMPPSQESHVSARSFHPELSASKDVSPIEFSAELPRPTHGGLLLTVCNSGYYLPSQQSCQIS